MKRFLLSLLVVTMFVPGFSCSNMPCAQAAPVPMTMKMQAGMTMPCDHCPPPDASKQTHNLMLMSDCTHTPLLSAGAQAIFPALDHMHYDFIVAMDAPNAQPLATAKPYAIRGPPDAAVFQSSTPLYLSTLRIRI